MMNKMSGGAKRYSSVFLTVLIIGMLVMMGPASAVQVILSQPDDINLGEDVEFDITVDLASNIDNYLPIHYTDIIFTGPEGFEETCRVYNDGTYDMCDLDLDITVENNLDYEYGQGFGYDYNAGSWHYYGMGYGYGYGYGYYGEGPEISYNIIWHTDSEMDDGTYSARAELYTLGEDQYEQYPYFTYCGIMEGMYIEWLSLNPGGNDYDSNLDLNNDGVVGLSDLSIFATMMDSGCVFDEHYNDGLILWYPMNYGALNDKIYDISGNQNHGYCYGDACPTMIADANGNDDSAFYFDGDDMIVVPDNDQLDLTGDYSVAAWVNFDELIEGEALDVLSKEHWVGNYNNSGYAIEKYDLNDLYFIPYANSDPLENNVMGNVEEDVWAHMVVTYDEADESLKLYLDGELIAEDEDAVSILGNDNDLHIGVATSLSRFFKGGMDDLRIYDITLSSNDVNELYEATMENSDCSVLYGRFREFYRIQAQGNEPNPDLDLDGDDDVDLDDLIIFAQNMDDEVWCADQIALLFEAVEHAYSSNEVTFEIILEEEENNNGGGSNGGGSNSGEGIYIGDFRNQQSIAEGLAGEGIFDEDAGNDNEFEEQGNEQAGQDTQNGGLFNAITGAIIGAGESIGLGETLSYLVSLLLLFLAIFYGFRFGKRLRN